MIKGLVRFDWAMKKLLRSKANFGILEGFLSELLKHDVKILNLLESESNREERDDKQNRVDILAQLEDGEIVLIEVQTDTEQDYFHRMLYGTSKAITEHLQKGNAYAQIKKVYSVNILYFDLGQGKDYIYRGSTHFIGIHQNDELGLNNKQRELYQKEHVHQIYPEYYLLKVNQFNDVAKDTLDEWIYFLKNEEIKDNFQAQGLLEAKDKLAEMKLSAPEKRDYEIYLDNLRYQNSMFRSNYDSGIIDGEKKGIKKGIKEGIKEGRKMGIEEGIEKTKIETAKKMKQAGMSPELIRQITGIDEI